MIGLGIIGAGTIFQHQISALSTMPKRLTVSAVCDSDSTRLAQAKELLARTGASGNVRFCQSIEELTKRDCDAVLIATPPKTHYQIAAVCLEKGISVLLEKPAVLSANDLLSLYEKASRTRTLLHVAYHAAFAVDLLWWVQQQARITEQYALGSLSEIICGFYDPYVINGHTLSDKRSLLGSYIDSGVNQLSVCDRIVEASGFSLNDFYCLEHHYTVDETQTVVSSESVYTNGDVTIRLDTGWIYGLNRKRTVLLFKDCGKQIVLDHSNQRVILQPAMSDKDIISDMRRPNDIELALCDELLYEDTTEIRLKRHYMGVFSDFEAAYAAACVNMAATKRIHRLLLENQNWESIE